MGKDVFVFPPHAEKCALSKLSQCSQLTFVFLFEKQIRDLIQIDKR